MKPILKQGSVYGVFSLVWLIWVILESYTMVEVNRYYELGYGYLVALTIRDQFIGKLPVLLICAPLAHFVFWLCRRSWGLAVVLTTVIPLGILALNVWELNAALVSPFPSKLSRLFVMVSIAAAAVAAGLVLARITTSLRITRRILEPTAVFLDRVFSGLGRVRTLRYVSHPVIVMVAVLVTIAVGLYPRFKRPSEVARPSFLVILIDTLRADHMSIYGYPKNTTPFIDEWAGGATVFETGIAQASWTKPSVASLFTSLYPTVHRTGNGKPDRRHVVNDSLTFRPKPDVSPSTAQSLPDPLITLAEVFRNAGYRCGGFINNNLVSKDYGYGQGFDIYTGRAMNTENVTDHGVRWIEKNKDRPFFLYLHYMQPHSPYHPPERFNVFGADGESANVGGAYKNAVNFTGTRSIPPEELEEIVALYDGEILYNDDRVHAVLSKLQELGISERVVVVVTADHGEEFLDHGMVWHESVHLYDELTRVPMIVRVPGKMTGQRVETPIKQIDIAPTLISLAGLNPPPEMQGRSLAGVFEENPLSSRPIVSETIDYGYIQMFRDGSMKLIHDWESHSTELYNLDADPLELADLASQQPGVVAAMLDSLDSFNEINELWGAALNYDLVPADEKYLKKLRSLGYLD